MTGNFTYSYVFQKNIAYGVSRANFLTYLTALHKTPVLKVVLCTCFTDSRFIAFIHFGPIYMFVLFAVHFYICYFGEVSNQMRITSTSESSCQARIYSSNFRSQAGLIITVSAYWTIE